MTLIRNKDMTDLAFYYWMNNFPLSTHPLDWRRFLGFIILNRKHKVKKYNTYASFKSECLAYMNNLSDEKIDELWNEKQRVEQFLDDLANAEIPMNIELVGPANNEILQRNIINHTLYETSISRDEYLDGGISISEVRKRHGIKRRNKRQEGRK